MSEKLQKLFQSFATNLTPSPQKIKHTLVTTSFVLVAISLGSLLSYRAETIGKEWLKKEGMFIQENQQNIKLDSKSIDFYLQDFNATKPDKQRIKEQFKIIDAKAVSHANIILYFYTRLYTAIVLSSIGTIISGICLFYISKFGWEKANNYIINVFVTTTSITIFVGAQPIVFKQQSNIQENTNLYVNYVNLKNQALTYIAVKKDEKGNKIESANLILATEKKLNELNKIAIGFDSENLPKSQTILEKLPSSL